MRDKHRTPPDGVANSSGASVATDSPAQTAHPRDMALVNRRNSVIDAMNAAVSQTVRLCSAVSQTVQGSEPYEPYEPSAETLEDVLVEFGLVAEAPRVTEPEQPPPKPHDASQSRRGEAAEPTRGESRRQEKRGPEPPLPHAAVACVAG